LFPATQVMGKDQFSKGGDLKSPFLKGDLEGFSNHVPFDFDGILPIDSPALI